MLLGTLRKEQRLKVGIGEFLILQKLPDSRWQLQNCATGEWSALSEDDLLDGFAQGDVSFIVDAQARADLPAKVTRDLSAHPPELVALARTREQYLKEIDRQQPIAITRTSMEPLIRSVSERIKDDKPPGWLTVWRDYRKWIASGRDIRAIVLRHADRGKSVARSLPATQTISDRVIDELYMTPERKRVPEVHLEIVRRLSDANQLRPEGDRLSIPSQRTIYGDRPETTLRPHGCAIRQTPGRDGIQGVRRGTGSKPRSPARLDGSHPQRHYRGGRQQHVATGAADHHLRP